jgi:hypothetical protein
LASVQPPPSLRVNDDLRRRKPAQSQMLVSPAPDDRTALSHVPRCFFNRRIADGRERVAVQKARVLELKGRPAYGDAEGLLRVLERSLQLMIQYRAMLLDELMSWPDYR